jgi:hypothetical protein
MTTRSEAITTLKQKVKGLNKYLVQDDYENAVTDALNELSLSWPVSDGFMTLWHAKRAVRHCMSYLLNESAHKFKFEQINLQHRFDNYLRALQHMDREFSEALEMFPDLFADVEPFRVFGTKIDAGFVYDPQTGVDRTYEDSMEVIFSPEENDG